MGDSAEDNDLLGAFRDAMRHVSATVHAITTGHGGARYGIIATSVSSLSFDPPSLLVCINRSASLHDPLATTDKFCVNVLGVGNRDVAQCFQRGGTGEERFSTGHWIEEEGVPVLADAQSSLICRVAQRTMFGTHTIFVGEVTGVRHRANAKPLTYYDRRYIDITGAPDLPE